MEEVVIISHLYRGVPGRVLSYPTHSRAPFTFGMSLHVVERGTAETGGKRGSVGVGQEGEEREQLHTGSR